MPKVMRGMLRDLTGVHGNLLGEMVKVDINTTIVLFRETNTFMDCNYSWSIKKETGVYPRLSTEEVLRILNRDESENFLKRLIRYFY